MSEAFQSRGNTLVVVGAFAPAMFHPLWFARYDLLGAHEVAVAAKSTNLLVSNDISLFKISGFDFEIRPNRLQIGTTQESFFQPTRDLVCSLLEIIDSAPVEMIGINWTAHYATQSRSAWHAAGDKLVPKKFWETVWPKHVGMSNLSLELERVDNDKGKVNLSFQPSSVVENGVYFSINDHYELKSTGKEIYSTEAAKFLLSRWDASKDMAERLFQDVYTEITNV